MSRRVLQARRLSRAVKPQSQVFGPSLARPAVAFCTQHQAVELLPARLHLTQSNSGQKGVRARPYIAKHLESGWRVACNPEACPDPALLQRDRATPFRGCVVCCEIVEAVLQAQCREDLRVVRHCPPCSLLMRHCCLLLMPQCQARSHNSFHNLAPSNPKPRQNTAPSPSQVSGTQFIAKTRSSTEKVRKPLLPRPCLPQLNRVASLYNCSNCGTAYNSAADQQLRPDVCLRVPANIS